MTATVVLGSLEVCDLLGVTYRQLDYWLRNDVLPDTAAGSGSRRTFDRGDVLVLAVVAAVVDLVAVVRPDRRAAETRWLRTVAESAKGRQKAGLPGVGFLHVAHDGTVSGRVKAPGFIVDVPDPFGQ